MTAQRIMCGTKKCVARRLTDDVEGGGQTNEFSVALGSLCRVSLTLFTLTQARCVITGDRCLLHTPSFLP